MRKISLIVLCSSVLFATNGDNLIGLGVKSRAMGGIGIATHFGAENILANPAMISKSQEVEVNIGTIIFSPSVSANGVESDSDVSVMPEIFSSINIDENFDFGIGLFGAAGLGVNYQGTPELMNAKTNLMLMKFAPTLAYNRENFSIGFAPVVQYGSLDISYNFGGTQVDTDVSDDFGFGFALGTSYSLKENLKIGFVYKSQIKMRYQKTLSKASEPLFPFPFSDDLAQPAEYGVGISYDITNFNISLDYKKIMWGEAEGYKDFDWNNQDVYAIGTKYEKNGTWYALGYNHAKNPITIHTNATPKQKTINMFNYLMFPATSEDHFTAGAGTKISKDISIDFNIVYSPKSTFTVESTFGPLKVEHQETSVALSLKYDF